MKDRVRALRTALGLSQDGVAERSGGKLKRVEVNRIEAGVNHATSDRVRLGLATAFGLDRNELADYLESRTDLAVTLERIRKHQEPQPTSEHTPLDVAIAYHGDTISSAAAARVRKAAAGHEHEKTPMQWGRELRDAQQKLLEESHEHASSPAAPQGQQKYAAAAERTRRRPR